MDKSTLRQLLESNVNYVTLSLDQFIQIEWSRRK
jgi:hypothetical protein